MKKDQVCLHAPHWAEGPTDQGPVTNFCFGNVGRGTRKGRNDGKEESKLTFLKAYCRSFCEVPSIFNESSLPGHKGMQELADESPVILPSPVTKPDQYLSHLTLITSDLAATPISFLGPRLVSCMFSVVPSSCKGHFPKHSPAVSVIPHHPLRAEGLLPNMDCSAEQYIHLYFNKLSCYVQKQWKTKEEKQKTEKCLCSRSW